MATGRESASIIRNAPILVTSRVASRADGLGRRLFAARKLSNATLGHQNESDHQRQNRRWWSLPGAGVRSLTIAFVARPTRRRSGPLARLALRRAVRRRALRRASAMHGVLVVIVPVQLRSRVEVLATLSACEIVVLHTIPSSSRGAGVNRWAPRFTPQMSRGHASSTRLGRARRYAGVSGWSLVVSCRLPTID